MPSRNLGIRANPVGQRGCCCGTSEEPSRLRRSFRRQAGRSRRKPQSPRRLRWTRCGRLPRGWLSSSDPLPRFGPRFSGCSAPDIRSRACGCEGSGPPAIPALREERRPIRCPRLLGTRFMAVAGKLTPTRKINHCCRTMAPEEYRCAVALPMGVTLVGEKARRAKPDQIGLSLQTMWARAGPQEGMSGKLPLPIWHSDPNALNVNARKVPGTRPPPNPPPVYGNRKIMVRHPVRSEPVCGSRFPDLQGIYREFREKGGAEMQM